MADTTAMKGAERAAIALALGAGHEERRMRLAWGGEFAVDGASADGRTVAVVSTAGNAKPGPTNKMMKDAAMLMQIDGAERRVMIFTHPALYEYIVGQRARGRFWPASQIELVLIELPGDVSAAVDAARRAASVEVSPRRGGNDGPQ